MFKNVETVVFLCFDSPVILKNKDDYMKLVKEKVITGVGRSDNRGRIILCFRTCTHMYGEKDVEREMYIIFQMCPVSPQMWTRVSIYMTQCLVFALMTG